jgi:serine/threonine protein kinase/tetratricopeptide (TPR) repeat protein
MICPTQEEFRRLLAEDLVGPDAEALEAYVESCAACQRTLEELTSAARSNPRLLVSSGAEQTWVSKTGREFLRRLERTPPHAQTLLAGADGSAGLPHEQAATFPLPTVAGYSILRELGRGGMGVVYLARQLKPHRLVALKMILAGSHAAPEQLERFRLEAEVVARLQHPNIVQIHEVGEQEGLPFFSLEYVEGLSLPQLLAGTPQPAREAARLVYTLARAVDYAHQRGVVHRDLKPANILLQETITRPSREGDQEQGSQGEEGVDRAPLSSLIPKIADFGLAKRLDIESGQTRSGDIMGTPSYMAPEQASGQIHAVGPPVDIYALGAALYEMLTGRPPFKAETPAETIRQVVTEEPVRPTRLQRKVPYDIETICLQCLQKEPARRYVTAAALADDLERFINGQPIKARPTPWWEQGFKWAKRRPSLAGLVAVTILAALALLGGGLWYNAHLQAALADARQQRDKARERYQIAREAIQDFHTRVSESPELTGKGTERLRTRLLETALPLYERLVQEEGGGDVEAERARAYGQLGRLYTETGHNDQAEIAYKQALLIFQPLAKAHPDALQNRREFAHAYNQLAVLYRSTGRTDWAQQTYEKALEILKELTARQPDSPEDQIAVAGVDMNLGELYALNGRQELAERALKDCLAILEPRSGDRPEVQTLLAKAHNALGVVYLNSNRIELAVKPFERALVLNKGLAKKTPAVQTEVVSSYTLMGRVYRKTRRYILAEDCYGKASALCKELAAEHPTIIRYRGLLAQIYLQLGDLFFETQRNERAKNAYLQALEIEESLTAANPEMLELAVQKACTCANLASLWERTGRSREALESYDKSTAAFEAVLKREPRHTDAHRGLVETYADRAMLASRLGRQEEAVSNLNRALELEVDDGKAREVLRVRRALVLAYLRDHPRAVAEANEVGKGASVAPANLYNLACVFSLATAAVRQDDKRTAAERDQLAGQYATRGIEVLAEARAAGFFNDRQQIEQLKKDTDLDPIRSNQAFKKLVGELDRK